MSFSICSLRSSSWVLPSLAISMADPSPVLRITNQRWNSALSIEPAFPWPDSESTGAPSSLTKFEMLWREYPKISAASEKLTIRPTGIPQGFRCRSQLVKLATVFSSKIFVKFRPPHVRVLAPDFGRT